jgi:hypothetical protein
MKNPGLAPGKSAFGRSKIFSLEVQQSRPGKEGFQGGMAGFTIRDAEWERCSGMRITELPVLFGVCLTGIGVAENAGRVRRFGIEAVLS